MRLCSIILFVLSVSFVNESVCISKLITGSKKSLNKIRIIENLEKNNNNSEEIVYYKKIPQREQLGALNCAIQFCAGVGSAISDNIRYILKSFAYPIESIIRISGFCKRITLKIIDFVIHPKPDHVYAEILDKKMAKLINFLSQMSMSEKSKWFGYVATDFLIGYYAPYGLGWKVIAMTRNTALSIKSLKYFELLNKASSVDLNILKMVNSRNTSSLLNIKYGFEYADQFKQYLNDIVRHDSR